MDLRIKPSSRLSGQVEAPGDKSISHRALMHAALAQGVSRIENFLCAGVTEAMIRCVRDLGVGVEAKPGRGPEASARLIVHGGQLRSPSTMPDCGNSGATIRMLMGALAGQRDLTATLTGSAGLRRRPMKRVAEPLRLMGAYIVEDTPPLTIVGRPLHGIDYTLPVASAQVKAAILLAALQADSPTTLHELGPSRDHSERMLQALGVSMVACDRTLVLTPPDRPLPAFDLAVPGDISSAAFLLAAAALAPDSCITLSNVGVNPTRTGILDALAGMGARVEVSNRRVVGCEPIGDVTIETSELRGIAIDGEWVVRMIDEFPILAVLATQARGKTIVHDAEELRLKESDRIASLVGELRQLGAHMEEQPDGFVVEGPTPLHGACVDSHGDHRLAMSLAVAGLIARGEMTIVNAEAYHESFPNFVELMRTVGADISDVAETVQHET